MKAVLQSRRILITGGAGFIGSRLTRQLLEDGHECLVIDNLSAGTPAPAARERLAFEPLGIGDRRRVESRMKEFFPHAIVHLAAIHHIPTCEKNAAEAFRVNILGFQVVLDAAAKAGCGKVVLASSGAVYDWCEGPLNEEATPARPCDIYSLSKYTGEQQLRLWAQNTGAEGAVARIFNTIGANDPNAHLIPDILRQLESGNGKAIVRLGNTHTRRDYIYVEDTAACLKVMAESCLGPGVRTFNVGTGVESDVAQLVRIIAVLKGKDCEVVVDPARVRRVDRTSQLADIRHTAEVLGWRPRYPLQEALRLAVQ